jgi:glyoxylase-like metal-dependent hydrolase (beta-lactamase superfamily II)
MYNRRTFIRNTALAGGLFTLAGHNALAAFLQADPGKMIPLRGNVGYYSERGGTIGWYLHDDGIAVVDTQFPEQAGHLIEQLRQKSQKAVDLLFNTHHHGDHTGGNIAFKGIVNNVIAHANSRVNQEKVAIERKSEAQQLYPDTIFEKDYRHKLGGETITAKYFGPGHTNGDIVVHFENADIAHVGDLMFNRRFPFIDKTAGASISNWIEVLGQIRKTFHKDTLYIFGHANEGYPVTGTREDLSAMQNYLEKLLQYTRKAYTEGTTEKDLIAKTTSIPGAEEWKGQGIERSISAAYLELKGL